MLAVPGSGPGFKPWAVLQAFHLSFILLGPNIVQQAISNCKSMKGLGCSLCMSLSINVCTPLWSNNKDIFRTYPTPPYRQADR